MTTPTYDDIADWYDAWVSATSLDADPIFATTRTLLGTVSGLRICDVACGQGRISRALAAEGASVLGVDASAKLIDLARTSDDDPSRDVTYLCASASDRGILPGERFDGVLCHMALMDIEDFASTLRNVDRLLVPGGWFVFSILHPCFQTPASSEVETAGGWGRTVRGYFAEGLWISATRPGPPDKVGAYHRTLTTYLNAILEMGLALERFAEPRFADTDARRRPVWAEVPAVLVGRCRKQ